MAAKDRGTKPPTIYDVARVAGVSHQTVSRYLSGVSPLRPASRERVEQAVQQLGYVPNLSARLLARGESRTVVVLTSELLEVGTIRLVEGVRQAARAAGYFLDVQTGDAERVGGLARGDVAGILALAATDDLVRDLEGQPIGEVVLTVAGEAAGVNTVETQAEIARHLAALGHREVVYLAGPGEWAAARARLDAFEQAAAVEGLHSIRADAGQWSAAAGYEAALGLDLKSGATAIVCGNDQIALGVISALHRRGVSVPGEISVVGYDDVDEAAFFLPPLTTVRQDFALHGAHAWRRIHELIEPEARLEPLPPVHDELIVRGSTAARVKE